MKLSIRYDLCFQDALLRYTDAQIDLSSGSPNPDGGDNLEPTLRQEQDANFAYMTLCDMIDLYIEKRLADMRREVTKAAEKAS